MLSILAMVLIIILPIAMAIVAVLLLETLPGTSTSNSVAMRMCLESSAAEPGEGQMRNVSLKEMDP